MIWVNGTNSIAPSFQQIINPASGLNDGNSESITPVHATVPLRDVPPRLRGIPPAELQQIKTAIGLPIDGIFDIHACFFQTPVIRQPRIEWQYLAGDRRSPGSPPDSRPAIYAARTTKPASYQPPTKKPPEGGGIGDWTPQPSYLDPLFHVRAVQ
jgi:hypothetical protein